MEWKNHQTFRVTLVTLIVGVFLFAQAYIVFSINQINNRIAQIESRLETLNQNYINHLAHHIEKK